MNSRQDRVCRAAESSVTCARRLKPDQPRVAAAADRLEAAVKGAHAASAAQESARVARGLPHNSAERAKKILFHKHLVPIATDGLELLAGREGVAADLQLPRFKAPAEEHLRAATRVRGVVTPYEAIFVDARNYAPDFLEHFERAARDLSRAASAGKGAGRAEYTAATRDVDEAVKEVQRCFDSLDARINEACFEDRMLLREWRKCTRIPGKIGRPKSGRVSRSRATTSALVLTRADIQGRCVESCGASHVRPVRAPAPAWPSTERRPCSPRCKSCSIAMRGPMNGLSAFSVTSSTRRPSTASSKSARAMNVSKLFRFASKSTSRSTSLSRKGEPRPRPCC